MRTEVTGPNTGLSANAPSVGAAMIPSRSVIYNSLWNYAGAGFTAILALATTPIYLQALGIERFGIMALLAAIVAPIGVLNAGLTQATIKFVASYSAQGQFGAAREAVAASLFINFTIGSIGGIGCALGAPLLMKFGFKISPELLGDAQVSLRLMGGVWFFSQIAGNFRCVLEGLRDTRKVATGDAISAIATALLCSSLALCTGRLVWFIAGQLAVGFAMTLFWWAQAKTALSGITLNWKTARKQVRPVFSYSIWQVVNAGVAIIANVGDTYFIGFVFSAITLGAYNVGLRVQSVARTLFYSVNRALFPAASAAIGERGTSERLVVTATWHLGLLVGMLVGWLAVTGPALVEFWVGSEIAETAGLALRVLVLTLLFEIPSATGSSYLNAHSLTRLTAYNNLVNTILTIGLMIPLGLRFGLAGVAASPLLALVLARFPFHLWMHRHFFDAYITQGAFMRAFYGVGLCCLFAATLTCLLFDYLYRTPHGVIRFLYASLISGPVMLVLVLVGVLGVLHDRARLRELRSVIATNRKRLVAHLVRRVASTKTGI